MSEEITKYFDLKNDTVYQYGVRCKVAVMGDTIIDFVDVNKADDIGSGRMTFFYKPDREYIGGSLKELEKDMGYGDESFSKKEISAQEFTKSKDIRDEELKDEDREYAWKLSDAKDRVAGKILERKARDAGYEKPKSYIGRKPRKDVELSM